MQIASSPTATRGVIKLTTHLQYINGTATTREKIPSERRASILRTFATAVLETQGQRVSELRETLFASSTPPIDARDRHSNFTRQCQMSSSTPRGVTPRNAGPTIRPQKNHGFLQHDPRRDPAPRRESPEAAQVRRDDRRRPPPRGNSNLFHASRRPPRGCLSRACRSSASRPPPSPAPSRPFAAP